MRGADERVFHPERDAAPRENETDDVANERGAPQRPSMSNGSLILDAEDPALALLRGWRLDKICLKHPNPPKGHN
jgi:hypothetical protein